MACVKAVFYGVLLLALAYGGRLLCEPKPDRLWPVEDFKSDRIARNEQGAAVPSVRILLFTEKEHKMITSITTDENGMFSFENIPYGRYRLVAKSAFCPANVPIEIGHFGKKQLHLHMIAGAIDTCSYGTLKN